MAEIYEMVNRFARQESLDKYLTNQVKPLQPLSDLGNRASGNPTPPTSQVTINSNTTATREQLMEFVRNEDLSKYNTKNNYSSSQQPLAELRSKSSVSSIAAGETPTTTANSTAKSVIGGGTGTSQTITLEKPANSGGGRIGGGLAGGVASTVVSEVGGRVSTAAGREAGFNLGNWLRGLAGKPPQSRQEFDNIMNNPPSLWDLLNGDPKGYAPLNSNTPKGLLPGTKPRDSSTGGFNPETGKFYNFGTIPIRVRFPSRGALGGVAEVYVFDFQLSPYDFTNESGGRTKGIAFQYTEATKNSDGKWVVLRQFYGFNEAPSDTRIPKGVDIDDPSKLEFLPVPGETVTPTPIPDSSQSKSVPGGYQPPPFSFIFPPPVTEKQASPPPGISRTPNPIPNPIPNPTPTPTPAPMPKPTPFPAPPPGLGSGSSNKSGGGASSSSQQQQQQQQQRNNRFLPPPITTNVTDKEGKLDKNKIVEIQEKEKKTVVPDQTTEKSCNIDPCMADLLQKQKTKNETEQIIEVTVNRFLSWNPVFGRAVYAPQKLKVPANLAPFVMMMGDRTADIRARHGLAELRAKLAQLMHTLTVVSTLHNAAMLSSNLAQTLGDLVTEGVQTFSPFFGVDKDLAETFDANEILGKTINETLEKALGKEVWEGTKTTWLKLNRIITTGTNIVWTVRSMADSAREVAEWTAENTGKIGNALKRFRVVGENAYPWMPEQMTMQNKWLNRVKRATDGIESIEDAASSLTGVVSEVRSAKDEFSDLKEQKENFDKAIKEATSKVRPDNDPTKKIADDSNNASKSPSLQVSDRAKGDAE